MDEYEAIIRTRKTQRPPIVLRAEDPDYPPLVRSRDGAVAGGVRIQSEGEAS